jgi:hypothetical protein
LAGLRAGLGEAVGGLRGAITGLAHRIALLEAAGGGGAPGRGCVATRSPRPAPPSAPGRAPTCRGCLRAGWTPGASRTAGRAGSARRDSAPAPGQAPSQYRLLSCIQSLGRPYCQGEKGAGASSLLRLLATSPRKARPGGGAPATAPPHTFLGGGELGLQGGGRVQVGVSPHHHPGLGPGGGMVGGTSSGPKVEVKAPARRAPGTLPSRVAAREARRGAQPGAAPAASPSSHTS